MKLYSKFNYGHLQEEYEELQDVDLEDIDIPGICEDLETGELVIPEFDIETFSDNDELLHSITVESICTCPDESPQLNRWLIMTEHPSLGLSCLKVNNQENRKNYISHGAGHDMLECCVLNKNVVLEVINELTSKESILNYEWIDLIEVLNLK